MCQVSSVQFSCSVVSNSLRPHELQHARPPCPSPTPGIYPNSCPSTQWWNPTISSSVIPFSSWPQFLPASGSFPMSQLLASGGQSFGASASTMNTQDGFPLGWTGWISLQSKGLSRVFSNITIAQLCPTLCTPMDFSPPGSSIYGIFQARLLKWVAISFSRGSLVGFFSKYINIFIKEPIN